MFHLRNLVSPCALAALALGGFAASVHSQSQFASNLNGSQETPANPSTARGRAWVVFDPVARQIYYRVEANVVNAFAAHIHEGPAGVPGPIVFHLSGGPNAWQGASPVMTDSEIATLFKGNYYFNIHSASFPDGEIRGQITPAFLRHLTADLDGNQAGSGSPGTGTATVVVRIPENVVTIRTNVTVTSGLIDAELHLGAPGTTGPLVFSLLGSGGSFCGTAGPFTTAEIDSIVTGDAYIAVHTSGFPTGNGEIRGQLVPSVEHFDAHLNGIQESPPNASVDVGFGTFSFNPVSKVLTYNVTWTGTGGTMAHVYIGVPTENGAIIIPLTGPANGPWSGVSAPLTLDQENALYRSRLYTNVHSGTFPNGEIRGIVSQNPDAFGWGGPTTAGLLGRILRIQDVGQPTLGNPSFGVGLTDAKAGTALALGLAPNTLGAPVDLSVNFGMNGHALWAIPATGFASVADGEGCTTMTFAVPAVPAFAGAEFFFQWLSIEPGANGLGVVSSDALHISLY